MIKSADIQQLGVGLGSLSNIVCKYFFRSSSTDILVSFADTCREQSTTDLPIIVVWFISNDNENVICDTNGPKEKIFYFQALMPEANPFLSINVIQVYIGSAVAWWLTPRTSDPQVGGSSPTRVAVLCPRARNVYPLPPQAWVIPGKWSVPT